jgi:hypothetical protein
MLMTALHDTHAKFLLLLKTPVTLSENTFLIQRSPIYTRALLFGSFPGFSPFVFLIIVT